ncbi:MULTISPECIES: glycosyltransferase [unclassified Curtobacterium]|uniref:glycosyltransferase n=1 Tax=unclassified Curtobacterium TaxID=257496 RepID=UPI0009F1C7B2|nr:MULTISPECIES: glycosyltransferase [unclassified Curtobacterium]
MTESFPVLSVVVPVGRIDSRFAEALGALRAQTTERLEIVLVLDGLGAAAADVVLRQQGGDPRIVVLTVPSRGGAGNARNVGLRRARGEYVAFADADDLVPHDAYERLLAAIGTSTADVVSGRAEQFGEDGAGVTYWTVDEPLWQHGGTGLRLADTPLLAHDHTPWNKVFRRAWLVGTGITFPVDTTCEDVSWWAELVVRAEVDVLPEVVYRHRRHGDSVTSGIGRGADLDDWTAQTKRAVETYQRHGQRGALEAVGRRLIRREAWTRVRSTAQFTQQDARSLVEFVRWMGTWTDADEFARLSSYPRTAYDLLRHGEPGLVSALVQTFDGPSPDAVESWRALAEDVQRVVRREDQSEALWRERLFGPVLDAAQRGERLPVPPRTVVAFWDHFVRGGLDEHEHEILAALRRDAVSDVAFLRRNRRLRVSARGRGGGVLVSVSGLAAPAETRMLVRRDGVPGRAVERVLDNGDHVVPTQLRRGDELVLEFPLASGSLHRVSAEFRRSRVSRVLAAVGSKVRGGR